MAKAEIAALRVSLGLESTQFSQRIKDIDRKLRAVNSEFKVAASSSDLFDDSLDSLRTRSENLTRKLELQKMKVVELGREYDQMKESGKANTEQLDKMAIKLNNAIAAMNRTERTLGDVNRKINDQENQWNQYKKSLDQVKGKLDEVAAKLKDVGEELTLKLSAPLAGFGILSGKVASDYESASRKIQRTTNFTAEEVEELGDVAEEVFLDGFGDSLEEVSDAVTKVRQNLGKMSKDELRDVSKAAIQLERDFGDGREEILRAAKALKDRFGLNAKEAFDYITKGYQSNLNYAGDFLDTISEYSTQFDEAGFTADQMFNLLAQGAENGAWNLDQLADAVKEFRIEAEKNAGRSAEAFEELGLNAEEISEKFAKGGKDATEAFFQVLSALSEVKDESDRATLGAEIFGTKWEDVGGQVLLALDPNKQMLDDIAGSSKGVADSAEEAFGQRFQSTLRSLQDALKPIGEVLLDLADRILPKVEEYANKFSDWFEELDPKVQEAIAGIGLFVVALGPLLAALAPVIQSIGWLITKIGGIPLAIASLIGAHKIFVDKLEEFKENAVGSIIEFAFIAVAKYNEFKEQAKAKIDELVQSIEEKFEYLKENWVQIVLDTVLAILSHITGLEEETILKIGNMVTSALDKFDEVKDMVNPVEEAKKSISGILDEIKGFFDNLKLKIPKPELPSLPTFDLKTASKTILGKTISYPTGFDITWHKTGGVFTNPVVMGNAGFGDVEEAIVPFEGQHARRIAGLIGKEMLPFINPQQQGVNITIQSMNVRDDTDIHKIARELDGLIRSAGRGVIL